MIEWGPSTPRAPCTLDGLIEHALVHGCTLESIEMIWRGRPVGVQYLRRETPDGVMEYPLPHDCGPERRVGPGRWMNACPRLRIPEPKWPIEM